MNESGFETWLREAINLMNDEDPEVERISTFEEAGILTRNKGLVVKSIDGREFQITVVQSK